MRRFLFLLTITLTQIIVGQTILINGNSIKTYSACDNETVELSIENLGNKYTGIQWEVLYYDGSSTTFIDIEDATKDKLSFVGQPTEISQYRISLLLNGIPQTSRPVTILMTKSNNDIFHITIDDNPNKIDSIFTICSKDSIRLTTNYDLATTIWNDGILAKSIYAKSEGVYTVEVRPGLGKCSVFDTVQLDIVVPSASIDIKNQKTTPLCKGDSIVLVGTTNLKNPTFDWNDGIHFNSERTAIETNTYVLEVNTSRGNCEVTAEMLVNFINPTVQITTEAPSLEICEGGSITLSANANFEYDELSWNAGEYFEKEYEIKKSGTYSVVISNGEFCKDSSARVVEVTPLPIIEEMEDKEFDSLPQVLDGHNYLTGNYEEYSFKWTNTIGQTISEKNILKIDSSNMIESEVISFSLIVANKNTSCSSMENINILYSYEEPVLETTFVPNVFKPDENNSNNNSLKVYSESIADDHFLFEVYNKWGQIVFSTNSLNIAKTVGWNGAKDNSGKLLQGGSYTYKIQGHYLNGSPFDKIGSAIMIR